MLDNAAFTLALYGYLTLTPTQHRRLQVTTLAVCEFRCPRVDASCLCFVVAMATFACSTVSSLACLFWDFRGQYCVSPVCCPPRVLADVDVAACERCCDVRLVLVNSTILMCERCCDVRLVLVNSTIRDGSVCACVAVAFVWCL